MMTHFFHPIQCTEEEDAEKKLDNFEECFKSGDINTILKAAKRTERKEHMMKLKLPGKGNTQDIDDPSRSSFRAIHCKANEYKETDEKEFVIKTESRTDYNCDSIQFA